MVVFIIWLVALVVIISNGWNTALWIFFIGSAVLVVAAATGNKKSEKKNRATKNKQPVKRIDHLHYVDVDEYECPKCGAKFKKNVMVCPQCRVRFEGAVEDDEEFIEEMVLWDDDD